jgi:hypothetical protein
MPPETDNLRLQELFEADQKDRSRVYDSDAAVQALQKRDSERRQTVIDMIRAGGVNTANDLYHASVIFMHGVSTRDYLIAHRLSTVAATMGHRPSRWLCAASLDRLLMTVGQPQVYGTQFEHNPEDNRYELRLPIDDSVLLGFEKRFFDVPAVVDRLNQLNKRISSGGK